MLCKAVSQENVKHTQTGTAQESTELLYDFGDIASRKQCYEPSDWRQERGRVWNSTWYPVRHDAISIVAFIFITFEMEAQCSLPADVETTYRLSLSDGWQ